MHLEPNIVVCVHFPQLDGTPLEAEGTEQELNILRWFGVEAVLLPARPGATGVIADVVPEASADHDPIAGSRRTGTEVNLGAGAARSRQPHAAERERQSE